MIRVAHRKSRTNLLVEADSEARAIGVSEKLVLFEGRKAQLTLNVIVIGCGLGGLAAAHCLGHAGHRVTVVESAPAIGEIGAGIQVTPNLSRLLIRWGLSEQLKHIAVKPEAVALRRWCTGEIVGWTKWGDTMEHDYGSPYYHIHRADFHRLLLDLAEPFAKIRLNSTVVDVNPSSTKPSIMLSTGEVLKADLIVGADGVKSMCREIVLGAPVKATPTGDAVYRAIIPTSKMMDDPQLRELVEIPEMTGWMGPQKHIMAYCIRARKEYNIVLAHPDDGSVESWTAEGSADKMRSDFAGWESRNDIIYCLISSIESDLTRYLYRVTKLLAMIPSTMKWKLMDRQPLSTWIHRDGRLVLLGDSCHPMLPYRAQGAAMAVEDAAVLGNLLSRLKHPAELLPLLRGYEVIRHARTAATQASSRLNQRIFHYSDGLEQEERDRSMRAAMHIELARVQSEKPIDYKGEGNSNQWADRRKNVEQFRYNADAEAERWWYAKGERICRQAVRGDALGGEFSPRL